MYTAFMVDCQLLMDFKGSRTIYDENYQFSLYICTPEIDGRQVREPFIRKNCCWTFFQMQSASVRSPKMEEGLNWIFCRRCSKSRAWQYVDSLSVCVSVYVSEIISRPLIGRKSGSGMVYTGIRNGIHDLLWLVESHPPTSRDVARRRTT